MFNCVEKGLLALTFAASAACYLGATAYAITASPILTIAAMGISGFYGMKFGFKFVSEETTESMTRVFSGLGKARFDTFNKK